MTATATAPLLSAAGDGSGRPRRGVFLALLAVVLAGAVATVILSPRPRVNTYLDPESTAASGSHALTDILSERGFEVIRTYTPAAALTAARSAGTGRASAVLVITSPDLLTARQRRQLAAARSDLLIVEPGPASLASLAPAVHVAASPGQAGGQPVRPGCRLTAARLAGSADIAGYTYRIPLSATGCYRIGGYPSLVRYRAAGRTITILASGAPLANGHLAANGNAALALNLLNSRHRVIWLTPEPPAPPPARPATAPKRAVPGLLPAGVWLLFLQLCVVVALTAIWRGRRLGPLITERLPVVVRASETVEGHARLYQARRARGRASSALREAMLGRVRPALGLAESSPQEAVAQALASRSARSQAEVTAVVHGPAPSSDAELVTLARNLDELEREVRSQ